MRTAMVIREYYRRPGIYNLLTNLYHDHVFHTDMKSIELKIKFYFLWVAQNSLIFLEIK